VPGGGLGPVVFRGDLPDFLTIPFANALLFAGFALDASALWEQAGRRVWRPYLLPALGAAIGLYTGAWLLQAPAGVRIAIGSVAAGFFFVAGAAALGRGWRSGTPLRRYLVLAMLVLSAAVVLRGLWSLLPEGVNGVSRWRCRAWAWWPLYLMMLSNAFGYLLLARAGAGRAGAAGSGRSADRCAEPARLLPGADAVDRAGAPSRHADFADCAEPRPVQARQRQLWPSGRRHGAEGDGRRVQEAVARFGPDGPPGRRRIRHPAAAHLD
jgi:hypothetical protein